MYKCLQICTHYDQRDIEITMFYTRGPLFDVGNSNIELYIWENVLHDYLSHINKAGDPYNALAVEWNIP